MNPKTYFDLLPIELIGEIAIWGYSAHWSSPLFFIDYRSHRYFRTMSIHRKIILKFYPTWDTIIQDWIKLRTDILHTETYYNVWVYLTRGDSSYTINELIIRGKLYHTKRWLYDVLKKVNVTTQGALSTNQRKYFRFDWNDFYSLIESVDNYKEFVGTSDTLDALESYDYNKNVYKPYLGLLYMMSDDGNLNNYHHLIIFGVLMCAFNLNYDMYEYLLSKIERKKLDEILQDVHVIDYLNTMNFRPCF